VNLHDKKLELTYPCHWDYKVIILKEDDIHQISTMILGDREHTVVKSNKSKTDKYHSYKITTLVHSDDDRTEIFLQFKAHSNVKIVL